MTDESGMTFIPAANAVEAHVNKTAAHAVSVFVTRIPFRVIPEYSMENASTLTLRYSFKFNTLNKTKGGRRLTLKGVLYHQLYWFVKGFLENF